MVSEPATASDHGTTNIEHCAARIEARQALIGVIGLGYVGQPLALAANSKGCHVVGFDIDAQRVAALNEGRSTLRTVSDDQTAAMRASKRFRATTNFAELAYADVIVICVPTPLSKNREPDLSFVKTTAEYVARTLRAGPADMSGVHILSRYDGRDTGPDPRSNRAQGGPRRVPRFFSRARRPRQPKIQHQKHPQNRGSATIRQAACSPKRSTVRLSIRLSRCLRQRPLRRSS